MNQLQGHPFVLFSYQQDPQGKILITCQCRACGNTWKHVCHYPPKAQLWVYNYAASHAHGNDSLARHFGHQYNYGMRALRQQSMNGM